MNSDRAVSTPIVWVSVSRTDLTRGDRPTCLASLALIDYATLVVSPRALPALRADRASIRLVPSST